MNITARNIATVRLARAAAAVTANDNATAKRTPAIGDRIECRGMCCEGSVDQLGTVVEISTNRWGTSYRIALDEGGEEWASSIEPRDTLGASFRYV